MNRSDLEHIKYFRQCGQKSTGFISFSCDENIVLKNGELTEQGTHETLLNKGGDYSDLWKFHNV
jgi:hypothetical protein